MRLSGTNLSCQNHHNIDVTAAAHRQEAVSLSRARTATHVDMAGCDPHVLRSPLPRRERADRTHTWVTLPNAQLGLVEVPRAMRSDRSSFGAKEMLLEIRVHDCRCRNRFIVVRQEMNVRVIRQHGSELWPRGVAGL
jgi:hypothetical protein